MENFFSLLLAFCILCSAAVPLAWADDDALRQVLQSRYDTMKTAMATHDDKALTALLAPDFSSVDISGRAENTSQMLAEVGKLKADPHKTSETTLLSLKTAGNDVVVEQKYDMKTVKTGADGTKHDVELITLSTDTWTKSADTWLIEKTVTKEMTYFQDGKTILHRP